MQVYHTERPTARSPCWSASCGVCHWHLILVLFVLLPELAHEDFFILRYTNTIILGRRSYILYRVRRQRGVHRLRRRRILETTDLSDTAVRLWSSPTGQRPRLTRHYGTIRRLFNSR